MTHPIIVGVDGSAHSFAAVRWAVAEADRRALPLLVLYAWIWLPLERRATARTGRPPGGSASSGQLSAGFGSAKEAEAGAQALVDQALALARAGGPSIEVSGTVVPDNPGPALVAASDDAALLVVGAQGAGGFAGQFLGSVSLQVAGHARCPVVVVRATGGGAPEEPPDATAPVLLGLDVAKPVRPAIRFAFEAAASRHTTLRALYAWNGPLDYRPPPDGPVDYDPVEALRAARASIVVLVEAEAARHPGVAVASEVAEDAPGQAIVHASAGAALTVVGARRRRFALPGLALGVVNHAVLHHAHGPVALVPEH
jgi:nucleotide-binding universal stress UspA family protein